MAIIYLISRIVRTSLIFTTTFSSLNRLFTQIFITGEVVEDASLGISFSTALRLGETCLTPPMVVRWSDLMV